MLENQSLLKEKIDCLNTIKKFDKNSYFSINCTYHNVPLSFHTKNESFYKELKSYLPSTWISDVSNFPVFIFTPDEFNIDLERWSNEESQDCFIENDYIIQRDFAARIHKDQITLIIPPLVCDGLYNFLRWYLPLKLLKKNKAIVHSSCILDSNNKAHFFLGHSGAGKTTITELSQNRTILGDDMNILSLEDGKIYAQAGAIGGYFKPEVSYDDKYEIESFNWIIQSQDDKREQLKPSESTTKLMASYANLFWDQLSQEQINFYFDLSLHLSQKVTSFDLYFTKSNNFWNLIEGNNE